MLFFLFGGGTRLKEIATAETRRCPRCHNRAAWMRLRRYHEVTFFFVPIARWGRRELEACPVCGEAQEVPRTDQRRLWPRRHATA